MAQIAEQIRRMSIEAFDAFIAGVSDARDYELIDGELVMMSNPTETHEQIASNIGARLKLAMDERRCRTYQGGMRVQANDDARGFDKYKPDIVVRCGASENRTWITDPVVLVEVLSPSTMDHDRGRKLTFYKLLPTAQHIVLVYADQMRVEHYARVDAGWERAVLTEEGDNLALHAVEFSMPLAQVYFDVAF